MLIVSRVATMPEPLTYTAVGTSLVEGSKQHSLAVTPHALGAPRSRVGKRSGARSSINTLGQENHEKNRCRCLRRFARPPCLAKPPAIRTSFVYSNFYLESSLWYWFVPLHAHFFYLHIMIHINEKKLLRMKNKPHQSMDFRIDTPYHDAWHHTHTLH